MKKLFLLLTVISLLGCNKMAPAGFWKNFDSKHIVENISDQGPWGGHRAIHWKNLTGRYNDADVIKFASRNGWSLIESEYVHDMDSYHHLFPMWITNGGMLYKFDSKWIEVDADTNKTAYGYVLISSDKTQMSIYHLWGE